MELVACCAGNKRKVLFLSDSGQYNTMIIVKETEHTKGDDWWKRDERGGYYVTTEYYLLEGDWKRFADCKKSMTQIIEHLKEVRQ